MCLGFACETNSLKENLVKRNIFKKRKPELVDTNDPPIMIKIKNKKLFWLYVSNENPILEILVINENKVIEKLLFWLKNKKKIQIKNNT